MAGYGIRSFLIAQSLNQIEKAYGPNNAILDNCHVRVAFATNDERTAKRVSDSLGTATEIRDAKNYAGHRLSPWLGHLMVSRQETARPLLTPGEIMQLPASDEIVLVSGAPPVRAKKARYYEDPQLKRRIMAPPELTPTSPGLRGAPPKPDDWTGRVVQSAPAGEADDANAGLRREPELPDDEEVVRERVPTPANEFDLGAEEPDDDAFRQRLLASRVRGAARQAALDPGDGIEL
jgi:type IV secretion system protein VirD4